jgi:acetyl esterase/lipase
MNYRFDPELAPAVPMLPQLDFSDVAVARATITAMSAQMPAPDASALRVENRTIEGPEGPVPVRIYRPLVQPRAAPALLYIHGGGFVVGSIETEHGNAIALASTLGIVVVAVGYRLAPEHPYPAGLHDCEAAFLWCVANAGELGIDAARLGVFGQSAGGGLTAALCLLRRDRSGPQPCFQFLGIPELDDRLQTPSMRAFADTPLWNLPAARYSWRYYLGELVPGSAAVPAYAAPARESDLAGLPPACVTVMEFDPLRDEGLHYAQRLLQAGVSVELHAYPGTFHGSSLITDAAISRRQWVDTCAALARGLGLPPTV